MAFFDKIKDTFQMGVNGVTSKAKGFSESGNLNKQISMLEDKILSMYVEIGKSYYNDNKNNTNDPFSYYLREIAVANSDLQSLKRQLSIIKGKMVCPSCNEEIPSNASFCINCGHKISAAYNTQNQAAYQGAESSANPRDYGRATMNNMRAPMGERESMPMRENVPVRKKVCPICGNPESFTASMCTNCGCHL